MAMVDRFLGGTAEGDMPSRPLTEIEAGLMRSLISRVFQELSYALEPLTPVQPRLIQFESNPQFAQITSATDMVITLELDLKVGANEGRGSLCVPFSSLQAVLDQVTSTAMNSSRDLADPVAVNRAVQSSLDTSVVDVSVHFEQALLSSAEIVALPPGDVVQLAHHVDRPLTLTVAGIKCFPARPGQRGNRRACLLVDPDEGGQTDRDRKSTRLNSSH